MAVCPYCKSADTGAGFDTIQCFSCAGTFYPDGTPTVPTSAVEEESSTYDGPGADLIDNPDSPPFRAKDYIR